MTLALVSNFVRENRVYYDNEINLICRLSVMTITYIALSILVEDLEAEVAEFLWKLKVIVLPISFSIVAFLFFRIFSIRRGVPVPVIERGVMIIGNEINNKS